jgi:hypothetical protein
LAKLQKHQIPNNVQIPISNYPNGIVPDFDNLVIGNDSEFGIWILGFQCLGKRFTFIALPLKIRGGTGSPLRPVVVLDE